MFSRHRQAPPIKGRFAMRDAQSVARTAGVGSVADVGWFPADDVSDDELNFSD